jgi:hypothetical protein
MAVLSSAPKIVRLAVAVGAQQLQIFHTVIEAVPVDVMKGNGQALPLPFGYSAVFASVLFETLA